MAEKSLSQHANIQCGVKKRKKFDAWSVREWMELIVNKYMICFILICVINASMMSVRN